MTPRQTVSNLALLALCGVLVTSPDARASWDRSHAAGGTHLASVSAVGDTDVFVLGYEFKQQSGISYKLLPRVFVSDDGGRSLNEVTGALPVGEWADQPTTIHFRDANTGWVAVGKKVYRTSDRGGSWTAATLSHVPFALHFTSAARGIAVGLDGKISGTINGGATWREVQSPTSVDLRALYFQDASNGWALGYRGDEYDDEDEPRDGVVLHTTDGGTTWTQAWTDAELVPSSIAFWCDGETGFLGVWKKLPLGFEAALLKTTDGGQSFADINLPLRVGELNFFGKQPINTGKILAQAWDGPNHGRLAAVAFLMKGNSTSAGGTQGSSDQINVWRVVNYETTDAGATWTKSDLGVVTASLSSMPPSDGDFAAGVLRDRHRGWLVGGDGAMWVSSTFCDGDAVCDAGYVCANNVQCVRRDACETSSEDPNGNDGAQGGGRNPGNSRDDLTAAEGGCGCGGKNATASALLSLAFIGLARRRAGLGRL